MGTREVSNIELPNQVQMFGVCCGACVDNPIFVFIYAKD